MKHKNFILVILVFSIFFSCDYQSKSEYIQEIGPPSSIAELRIDLFPAGDTLELFQPLNLTYRFDAGDRQFYEGYFKLGNKKWEINDQEGELNLNPGDFEPGYHMLLLRAYYKTGSGSVADIAGVEAYMAETQWVVVSDNRVAPALDQYEPIHQDQHSYRSILFHPTDPSRVYVSSSHEPGVIQYRLPGFTPEEYWEFPNPCIICNIDPHTGYMLVKNTAAGKLHVLDLDTGQILFSINSNEYSPKLFNSRLLSSSGFTLDISPYLPGK